MRASGWVRMVPWPGLVLMLVLAGMVRAQEAGTAGGNELAAFEEVVKRNIFNPNRGAAPPLLESESAASVEEPPPRRDRIVLNGVMIDGTNAYGFFDGNDPAFRKVVPVQSEIAGLTLLRLTSAAVVLGGGTNELTVRVSDELERSGDGPWRVIANEGRSSFKGAASVAGGGTGVGDGAGGTMETPVKDGAGEDAGMSEVLKRLLEKRRKEAE